MTGITQVFPLLYVWEPQPTESKGLNNVKAIKGRGAVTLAERMPSMSVLLPFHPNFPSLPFIFELHLLSFLNWWRKIYVSQNIRSKDAEKWIYEAQACIQWNTCPLGLIDDLMEV